MTAKLIRDLDTRDFGAETLRIGDLNADGRPEFLVVQSRYGYRTISCITALTLDGEILWQKGKPSADNGRLYSDLPIQIYDWDDDGETEVLFVEQARYAEPEEFTMPDGRVIAERASRYEGDAHMVVLRGSTGREKHRFPIPAPADDCFLFADLTGKGRREDFVVKDRYWNMWGVSSEGEELWHWNGPTGHYPAIADIDGDGKDEVYVGYALIDSDGRVIFSKEPQEKHSHQDAATIIRRADGSWRLIFGNDGVHCHDPHGNELWSHPLEEAQHTVVGHYRDDSEYQVAVVDRGIHDRQAHRRSTLYLYDMDGKQIWKKRQPVGSWAAAPLAVDWRGGGKPQCIFEYSHGPETPLILFDGYGGIVETFDPESVGAPKNDTFEYGYGARADVYGDSREEIITFSPSGVRVFANTAPLAIPTLYNNNLYQGM
jgi:rhamnogalacturonan endolyase